MKNFAIAVFILVGVAIGVAIAQNHSTTAATPEPVPSANSVSSVCTITPVGYTLVLTNNSPGTEEITGFVVTFDEQNGEQSGSDTEPGNATINGIETIQMQNWIEAGQSQSYSVASEASQSAATCNLATWYNGG